VKEHDDKREELILGEVRLGEDLVQGPEVLLQLDLDILEHAEAQLALLAATQEALDPVQAIESIER
jgi:hypothetical protein